MGKQYRQSRLQNVKKKVKQAVMECGWKEGEGSVCGSRARQTVSVSVCQEAACQLFSFVLSSLFIHCSSFCFHLRALFQSTCVLFFKSVHLSIQFSVLSLSCSHPLFLSFFLLQSFSVHAISFLPLLNLVLIFLKGQLQDFTT